MVKLSGWFGSSGIRGPFNVITPRFGMKLGMAVGRVFKSSKPAYIASDIRFTSSILKSAFMSGFSGVSGSIIDIGLCPTPVLSFCSSLKGTLGIMVTASHNPPSDNGFKLFLNGGECDKDVESRVEKELQIELNRSFQDNSALSLWKNVGNSTFHESQVFINYYIDHLLSKVEMENYEYHVILDCANNVPNLVSPKTFQKLGFKKVLTINDKLDGFFPGRSSEPSSVNLSVLKEVVVEEGADIGIAHDGDGDRFAIIDEQGSFVSSTALINFFLDNLDYSNPEKNKIVLTSDCTKQAFEIAEKKKADVITSRIGRNRDYVNEEGLLFLAEPSKLLFPELGKWIDGLYPVLKLLVILKLKKISNVMALYNERKILRKAFKISNDDREQVKSKIDDLPTLWSERISNTSTLDGLKLFFKDKSSLLLRFSGTEPKIKIYIESFSQTKNGDILTELKDIFGLSGVGFDC